MSQWNLSIHSEQMILSFGYGSGITIWFDEEDDRGQRVADARIMAAAPELLEALSGLYEHTKNNHNIARLNQAALEAIEAAVGRAPEGDAREEDEDE